MSKEKSASRPKIHRLPPHQIQEGELYISRTVLVICVAVLVATIVPAVWSFYQTHMLHPAHPGTTSTTQRIATDARPPVPYIHIEDKGATLMGMLVKMPEDIERGSAIHSMSRTDPISHQELINIIGRY